MAKAMKLARVLSGCAAAGLVAFTVASTRPAKAAGTKAAVSGFQVQSINVAQGASVPGNMIIEVTCSQAVNPDSVNPATLQIRGRNATNTGYSKQAFGSTQVVGNVIRFFPRLPTHLRDSTGKFYPQGSAKDSAGDNAAFQPQTSYQISVIGSPAVTAIMSANGRKLKGGPANTTQFTIAAASPPERLWTALTYSDSPPPQFSFSNPPDTVPSALGQYATHGGTQDVPSAILMSLFCTKVPLSPGAARNLGNVSATMLARKGDYTLRRPVFGSVFVEQNFDTTLLAFQPQVALADLGIYSLRVTKGVKDLTEQNDFAPNRSRDVLNTIYVFLSSARALAPTVPVSQLPDPPAELITDWPKQGDPGGPAARGVLKTNVLALGDTYPDEIDPRTMLVFTTRDEPVTKDSITVEFTKSENLFDPILSIGTVDVTVPGAASAVFTASGGDASLGDLLPTANYTVPATSFATGQVLNYRNVIIPNGVTVTLAGSARPTSPQSISPPIQPIATSPVTLKAITFQIDGQISADGLSGVDGPTSGNYSIVSTTSFPGGPGGPGGGAGGYNKIAAIVPSTADVNGSGVVGNDVNLVAATAAIGGRGGGGGTTAAGTYYCMGGGGGGGGARTAGNNGTNATYSTASWNGSGGAGGAGATGNADLAVLVGGAGGGAGGRGAMMGSSYLWSLETGSGGGGGGALMIQTAGILTVNATAVIHARGGVGGKGGTSGSVPTGGGAGGGGGGSVLLRSSRGFSFAASPATAISVAGGAGGTVNTSGSYYTYAGIGGSGGAGFVRLEDPNGAFTIAALSSTAGFYNPVGAGVPSYVYTKWIDLGVQDPRIVQWKNSDVVTVTTNDAIYVAAQMTKENPTIFGKPDLSALKTSDQSSTNTAIMSQWQPVKVHDLTGTVGGAFTATLGPIPGYPPNPPTEYAGFDPAPLNGKGYKFIRFRIYFQLDPTQTATSPMPYVDRIVTTFQYNF
jgi:hypothetical protein